MFLDKKLRYQLYILRGLLGSCGVFGKITTPLLVVGSPNSGTRALAAAIAIHPDITDHSEARLLWDKHFHHRNHDTHKTAHEVRHADVIRLRGNFCYYRWSSGKTTVMNRHPENSVRIHFIKRIFPDAKIVHIVRDGRAAVCSNYRSARQDKARRPYPFGGYLRPPEWRQWLHRPLLEQLAFMWNSAALYASREGQAYDNDYLEIRYEALPDAATALIPQVWSLLGLSWSESLLTMLPVFDNRNYKWQEELTNEEVATVEQVAHEGLSFFEYI